jgi:hypothetical protein
VRKKTGNNSRKISCPQNIKIRIHSAATGRTKQAEPQPRDSSTDRPSIVGHERWGFKRRWRKSSESQDKRSRCCRSPQRQCEPDHRTYHQARAARARRDLVMSHPTRCAPTMSKWQPTLMSLAGRRAVGATGIRIARLNVPRRLNHRCHYRRSTGSLVAYATGARDRRRSAGSWCRTCGASRALAHCRVVIWGLTDYPVALLASGLIEW